VEQYYHRLVTYLKWTDKGILAVGSCGGTAIKRRIEETGHLEAAYNMGKQLQ
jgi:hypothetical protein